MKPSRFFKPHSGINKSDSFITIKNNLYTDEKDFIWPIGRLHTANCIVR